MLNFNNGFPAESDFRKTSITISSETSGLLVMPFK